MSRRRTEVDLELQLDGEAHEGHLQDHQDGLEEALAAWPEKDRALWGELIEDAGSELQQEMLERGLAAGRSPDELHSFADAIRDLSDEDVFRDCTPPRSGFPLNVLLAAQADPLAAFELNGNELRRKGKPPKKKPAPAPASAQPSSSSPIAPLPAALGRSGRGFVAESPDTAVRRRDVHDLGMSDVPATTVTAGAPSGRFAEDLFNAAGRPHDLSFEEHTLDEGGMTIEKALPTIIEALTHGHLVPCVIGNKPGDFRRWALILQMQTAGKNRAYELYDPAGQEIVWANEGDLINRTELPFSDKIFRRLTAIALPRVGPPPTASKRSQRESSFEG